MGFLLDLVNLAVYIPFLKASEEEIGGNLEQLKKQQWFQGYLNDERYRKLILHDQHVRQLIGKFQREKLNQTPYQEKCQRKLLNTLQRKL